MDDFKATVCLNSMIDECDFYDWWMQLLMNVMNDYDDWLQEAAKNSINLDNSRIKELSKSTAGTVGEQ